MVWGDYLMAVINGFLVVNTAGGLTSLSSATQRGSYA